MNTLFIIAQVGFVLLTVIYFSYLLKYLFSGIAHTLWPEPQKRKIKIRILVSLIGWIMFVALWSLSGIMADFSKFPFNFMPVIVVPLVVSLILTFSTTFKTILAYVPANAIVHLQSFRFFVELLLWALFAANMLPIQMTFEGLNFDILSGITAPFIAWGISRRKISKPLLVVWNIACLGLLINIVTVAILSTPSPIRVFMNEPANTIVAIFPTSLLPGLLVPLAYTLHFFSLRQLLSANSTMPEASVKY
jgi:hypothetical protein